MNFLSQIIVKFRDLIKPTEESPHHPESAKDDQQHVMCDDEKLDEAIEESFPSSDSPGHLSKSKEDKNLH
jgi:hypothetical protein